MLLIPHTALRDINKTLLRINLKRKQGYSPLSVCLSVGELIIAFVFKLVKLHVLLWFNKCSRSHVTFTHTDGGGPGWIPSTSRCEPGPHVRLLRLQLHRSCAGRISDLIHPAVRQGRVSKLRVGVPRGESWEGFRWGPRKKNIFFFKKKGTDSTFIWYVEFTHQWK